MASPMRIGNLVAVIFFQLMFLTVSLKVKENFLDKCISSKNHKNIPGPESSLMAAECKPWVKKSCCTQNTTEMIDRDGTLSLHGIILDQCPLNGTGKLSEKCRKHFQKDTCFYECSPNLGPWIVPDPISKKTRKERVVGVPLCASDCVEWFHDCQFDFTCNDNWGKGWIWKNKGSPDMCPKTKGCKLFSEYFSDAKGFCENLFNGSFRYESDESSCMNLTPQGSKNEDVAEKRAAELARLSYSTKLTPNALLFTSLLVTICLKDIF